MITALFVILNILAMEIMLSLDNAAVLAVMVSKLPKAQQAKALEYGIWGAFILRGLSLAFISLLISLWWLKIVGGLYLIYLAYGHFTAKNDTIEEASDPDKSVIFSFFHRYLGVFWSTVALVEVMDLTFSMDNIFAVTAFTPKLSLIIIGVFIGIIAMRFVAVGFTKLLERFTFLENLAFIVIALLGVKLVLLGAGTGWFPNDSWFAALTSHVADIITSSVTLAIFLLPILSSTLLNYPKRAA